MARPKSTPTKTDAGAAPDGAELNANAGAPPDGADLNANAGAPPDGAGDPGAPPPPVEAPPEASPDVDILAIFAAFSPEALQDEKAIEATLPDGDSFELAFEPKGWRRALGGFDIYGLERSRPVLYGAPLTVNRRELVLAIKSVCKPGDVELEDLRVIRL